MEARGAECAYWRPWWRSAGSKGGDVSAVLAAQKVARCSTGRVASSRSRLLCEALEEGLLCRSIRCIRSIHSIRSIRSICSIRSRCCLASRTALLEVLYVGSEGCLP